MPNNPSLLFKALADENRLRILNLLLREELCVCQLECVLGVKQSNLSRHLTKLAQAGLIVPEKRAQFVFYRIDPGIDARYPQFETFLRAALESIPVHQSDLENLARSHESGMLCMKNSCSV
ncbi:MAG: helix-turn-helix transcriptional regulator [Brevinematales bacterium]|nr:helix-turn-helix transcriptional regulator [Brevinematales bacterium]